MAEGFLSVGFRAGRARVLSVLVPDGELQAANASLGAGLSAARVVGPARAVCCWGPWGSKPLSWPTS